LSRKVKKKAKQGRLKIRVVLTAAGLLGAACSSSSPTVAWSVLNNLPNGDGGEVTNLDAGRDRGVDAGPDAGKDASPDGGDGG
jgi:hypothetical protein